MPNLEKLTSTNLIKKEAKLSSSIIYLDVILTDEDCSILPLNLETLHINGAGTFTGSNISKLPQTISVLSIKKSTITDEFISNIPINLTTLILESCEEINGSFITNLPPLQKLHVVSCTKIEDKFLELLPKSIIDLEISSCNIKVSKLNNNFPPNLTALNLSNTKVRNPPLASLKFLTQLTNLNLDFTLCSDHLFSHLPVSLIDLSMQDCNLTNGDVGLPPNLKIVNFRGCKINNQLFGQLPDSIRILDIKNSKKENISYTTEDLDQLPPLQILKVIIPEEDEFVISNIKKDVIIG